METEILNAMNEGLYLNQMMMLKVIALVAVLLAVAGFVVSLAGIAWLCFKENQRSLTARTSRCASPRQSDTRVRTTFTNKPRVDVRDITSRLWSFATEEPSTPPA